MHCDARTLLVSLTLLVLGGCDLKRELVGETLPSDDSTGGPADATSETGEAPTSGAPDGAPCELGPPFSSEEMVVPRASGVEYGGGPILSVDLDCAGALCLYAADVDVPACDGDADCATDDDRFLGCGDEQRCEIDPAWGEAHTSCTRTCEDVSDCPAIAGCATGPVCTPIAKLGPLCCQSVCACGDELDADDVATIQADCNAGLYCQ